MNYNYGKTKKAVKKSSKKKTKKGKK